MLRHPVEPELEGLLLLCWYDRLSAPLRGFYSSLGRPAYRADSHRKGSESDGPFKVLQLPSN